MMGGLLKERNISYWTFKLRMWARDLSDMKYVESVILEGIPPFCLFTGENSEFSQLEISYPGKITYGRVYSVSHSGSRKLIFTHWVVFKKGYALWGFLQHSFPEKFSNIARERDSDKTWFPSILLNHEKENKFKGYFPWDELQL